MTVKLSPTNKRTALEIFPVLQAFEYEHLPESLQVVSRRFCYLAYQVAVESVLKPDNVFSLIETGKAIDHLLYAKDAAVRASLP